MNKSRAFLEGSMAHTFTTHKLPDGRYKVKTLTDTASHMEWFGKDEPEAIESAKTALHDMALKGEL